MLQQTEFSVYTHVYILSNVPLPGEMSLRAVPLHNSIFACSSFVCIRLLHTWMTVSSVCQNVCYSLGALEMSYLRIQNWSKRQFIFLEKQVYQSPYIFWVRPLSMHIIHWMIVFYLVSWACLYPEPRQQFTGLSCHAWWKYFRSDICAHHDNPPGCVPYNMIVTDQFFATLHHTVWADPSDHCSYGGVQRGSWTSSQQRSLHRSFWLCKFTCNSQCTHMSWYVY